ncbi:hypothetical protein BJY04DRAFT_225231 [Aspergillus karnatakaensis]|uniref:uncharacterized protein n=1 Tax=Aspergillus karnatakaensis TaxID=1810916 RepID=UPI003CCC97F7
MSAPTGQFHGLSICSAETETGTDTETESALRQERGELEQRSTTLGGRRGADMTVVKASSGVVYDLEASDLDSETRSRALLGLTADFDILFCGSMRGGIGYEFVFAEQVRVQIDLDETTAGLENRYRCTCAVFQARRDVACQHIFWLLDQLQGLFVSDSPSLLPSRVLLSSDGHAQGFMRIERLVSASTAPTSTATLESLASRLGWSYVRSVSEGAMSRTQRVRDILSAFSTESLPEEFRIDLVEEEDRHAVPSRTRTRKRTPEQCVVQGDLEATIFRLAVHDDHVFAGLCKAMPPGACAVIYFDKAQERIRRLLLDFDRFCKNYGAPNKEQPLPHVTTTALLSALESHAINIRKNIHTRSPHGLQGAAKALITLLEDISTRDKDALQGNMHGRTSFSDEDDDQRNLYHQLIWNTGSEDEIGAPRYFVLDALEDLARMEDLHPFKSRLEAILYRIEVNRAPRDFILKLGAIVRGASEGAGLGRKRSVTGTAGEGGGKRAR